MMRRIENTLQHFVRDRVRQELRAHIAAFIDRPINTASLFVGKVHWHRSAHQARDQRGPPFSAERSVESTPRRFSTRRPKSQRTSESRFRYARILGF